MQCVLRILLRVLLMTSLVIGATHTPDTPEDGSDLETFVTRPELRPPKMRVKVHNPDLVTPGYYLVSPYNQLKEREPSTMYEPFQTGPHIYDQRGNLVWSGARFSRHGRAVFDFKMSIVQGEPHLSMLLVSNRQTQLYPAGAGLVLNRSCEVVNVAQSLVGSGIENMHEFNVIEDGRRALMITNQMHHRQYDKKEGFADWAPLRSIGNLGFVELDLISGSPVFEWWALDRVSPLESVSELPFNLEKTWDWLHLNSVDKNEHGDYLISSRYANTIYKVSGFDGAIIWRLGGRNNSFTLNGFNFSGQHDARFVRHEQSRECVSFLNNAASDVSASTSACSSGMIVWLDIETMTANLVREYGRPDGLLSKLRGNMQMLPNSDVLINWSDNGFMSESTENGRHILDFQFTSPRLTTYRGYKFNFSLEPEDNPVLRAFVYGNNPNISTTVFYVSWNGATEVASWRFFASRSGEQPSLFLGETSRNGFETRFMAFGSFTKALVFAINKDGNILGRSPIETVYLPSEWSQEKGIIDLTTEAEKANSVRMSSSTLHLWDSFAEVVLRHSPFSGSFRVWGYGLLFILLCAAILLKLRGRGFRGKNVFQVLYIYAFRGHSDQNPVQRTKLEV